MTDRPVVTVTDPAAGRGPAEVLAHGGCGPGPAAWRGLWGRRRVPVTALIGGCALGIAAAGTAYAQQESSDRRDRDRVAAAAAAEARVVRPTATTVVRGGRLLVTVDPRGQQVRLVAVTTLGLSLTGALPVVLTERREVAFAVDVTDCRLSRPSPVTLVVELAGRRVSLQATPGARVPGEATTRGLLVALLERAC